MRCKNGHEYAAGVKRAIAASVPGAQLLLYLVLFPATPEEPEIAGSIGRLKRALERICLFECGQQSDGSGQSHRRKHTTLERVCQSNLAARRFLCRLKSAEEAP